MTSTYRVIAPKEKTRHGNDFTELEDAEILARSLDLRPLCVVRVIDIGTDAERYETVSQFTK